MTFPFSSVWGVEACLMSELSGFFCKVELREGAAKPGT